MQRKARAGAAQVPDHEGVVHEPRVEPAASNASGKFKDSENSSKENPEHEGNSLVPGAGWDAPAI